MAKRILERPLPNPPAQYDQSQFNQIIRQLNEALTRNWQDENAAEEAEAIEFFFGGNDG